MWSDTILKVQDVVSQCLSSKKGTNRMPLKIQATKDEIERGIGRKMKFSEQQYVDFIQKFESQAT